MDTNVVGYYRTSSNSNVGEDKDTKKRQQNAVMNYASSNGMNVVAEFYDKGVSGTKEILNRTSFMEMLNYCEDNSIDTIVFESSDRLSRDLIVMDCIGYTRRHEDEVRKAAKAPILRPRAALGAFLSEVNTIFQQGVKLR